LHFFDPLFGPGFVFVERCRTTGQCSLDFFQELLDFPTFATLLKALPVEHSVAKPREAVRWLKECGKCDNLSIAANYVAAQFTDGFSANQKSHTRASII